MTRPTPRSLIRLALTPRWLLALVVVLALAAASVLLGLWQWSRTNEILAAERAAIAVPIAVEQAVPADELPAESIGRSVTAAGDFDPELTAVVTDRVLTDRVLDDRPGEWAVAGLRLADGRVVAVLRGWVPTGEGRSAPVPEGQVAISGVLQPDDNFYAGVGDGDQLLSITRDGLESLWGTEILPGYVVQRSIEPAQPAGPVSVAPTVRTSDVAFPLQNFVYAIQWWVFAAFGLVVFGRWLWIDARKAAPSDGAGSHIGDQPSGPSSN